MTQRCNTTGNGIATTTVAAVAEATVIAARTKIAIATIVVAAVSVTAVDLAQAIAVGINTIADDSRIIIANLIAIIAAAIVMAVAVGGAIAHYLSQGCYIGSVAATTATYKTIFDITVGFVHSGRSIR